MKNAELQLEKYIYKCFEKQELKKVRRKDDMRNWIKQYLREKYERMTKKQKKSQPGELTSE